MTTSDSFAALAAIPKIADKVLNFFDMKAVLSGPKFPN